MIFCRMLVILVILIYAAISNTNMGPFLKVNLTALVILLESFLKTRKGDENNG